MPSPMPVTNVVELVMTGVVTETGGSSKNIVNVFHYFQSPNVPSPPSAALVAQQFRAHPWADIAAQLSAAYVASNMTARYLDDATNQAIGTSLGASGAIALPRLSSAEAVVTPLQTGLRGKSFRGSKHFGVLPAASVVGDELTAGAEAAWLAVAAAMLTPLTVSGQTFVPCIVSKTLSQLRFNPTFIIAVPLTAVLVNKTIGTMRKRKEPTVR